jgi:hypothetical protein
MRVLIVCPVAATLFDPTLKSIFALDLNGCDRADLTILRAAQTDADPREAITAQYNHARLLCLEGGYDALLTIECDMVVPPDALRRLLATGADVAYGLYVLRRPPFEWNCYSVIDGMQAYPLSLVAPERAAAQWGQVVAVDGIGFGCTLIRRRVLEAFPFRASGDTHADGKPSYNDWYAAQDYTSAGFTQVCDTGLVCGHIHPTDEHGTMNPSVIWPIGEAPFYRFDAFDTLLPAECVA